MQLPMQRPNATPNAAPNETPNATPTPERAEVSPISTNVAFIVILLLIIVAIACFQWYRRSSINKDKKKAKNDLEKALGKINEIAQIIDPIVQFSKGESEQYLRAIKERFYTYYKHRRKLANRLKHS